MATSHYQLKRPLNARHAAAEPIAEAADRFPDVNPGKVQTGGLSGADTQLARLLYRQSMQRWLTIQAVVEPQLTRPFDRLEPKLQAVLLVGAAQVLFVDSVPDYAAVDASVELAKRWIRPKAGGLVNAVLRKVVGVVSERCEGHWDMAADRIPLFKASAEGGGWIQLHEKLLPPVKDKARHLSAATGVPQIVVDRWLNAHGARACREICVHAGSVPPMIVSGLEGAVEGDAPEGVLLHEIPGYGVFTGSYDALREWLAAEPERRRVQDPTAAASAKLTSGLSPKRILDYCAGRGTKTRQLAQLHPEAVIDAWDPDAARQVDLEALAAENSQVNVLRGPEAFADEAYDLLVLDVPCSNTGVLARRPEARFRFGDKSLASLIGLQRSIARQALRGVKPDGAVLYATCSIEPEENGKQAVWIARRLDAKVMEEKLTLPGGLAAQTHQDGGFAALIQLG